MKIDTDELKRNSDIVDVIQNHVPLTRRGAEYYGVCPFHEDTKESLQVSPKKQIFKCFACDDNKGGDSIKFLQLMGHTFHEACEEINGGPIKDDVTPIKKEAKTRIVEPVWTPVLPVKKLSPTFKHYFFGDIKKKWTYVDKKGKVLGYVCRFDFPDGHKEVWPLTYVTDGTKTEWRWHGMATPRPLYNLDLIFRFPNAQIIVVEGEKTADAAQAQLDPEKYVVTTWVGGANGIKNANWEPIHGRFVGLWPDNDTQQKYGKKHPLEGEIKPWNEQPGNHAMLAINEILKPHAKSPAFWVDVPKEFPHKWDAADKEWIPTELEAFVTDNAIPVPKPPTPKRVVGEKGQKYVEDVVDADGLTPKESKELMAAINMSKAAPIVKKDPPKTPTPPESNDGNIDYSTYFRLLGYDSDENSGLVYYFFSYEAKTVVRLSPSRMTKSNMMTLAPIEFWENRFPGTAKMALNIDQAQQFLITESHKRGPFREKYIRGRGAWTDGDELVIHNGEELLVNGVAVPLKEFKSRFVYQIGETLGFDVEQPALKTSESAKLIKKMEWLNWDRGINAYLLAGWCVIAPFCGVLPWRPHVWVTGPAGSGKSWVMDAMLKRLVGEPAVVVQGKTTEAGVRGMLQSDARPVLFDESDVDGYPDRERVQAVLALARSASSKNGGVIGKGSQSGGSRTFVTRSMFAFSSIGLQLNQQSDRTRFTLLGLLSFDKDMKKDDFNKFEMEWKSLVDDAFVKALHARTIKLLPVIIKNSLTFGDAASHLIGNRRMGDQIGGMLAGAYSLTNQKEISYEDAVEWCGTQDWEEEKGLELTKDEYQLFSIIAMHIVQVECAYGRLERSIGELIMIAAGRESSHSVMRNEAANRIRRIGIMFQDDKILIANTSPPIKEIIRNTAWANGHNKLLERLPGAIKMDPRQFIPGLKARSVAIPIEVLAEGYKAPTKTDKPETPVTKYPPSDELEF